MPIVATNYDLTKLFQGPMDIYLDVAAPPSAVPPVQGTNTLTLDASGQPSDTGTAGVHLGIALGPATLTLTDKIARITGDQFAADVAGAFVSQRVELDIALKELNLANISKLSASSATLTYFSLTAGITNPARDFVQLGTARSSGVRFHTLLIIGPRRDVAAKFAYVMLYRAILVSSLPFEIARKKETDLKLKFKGFLDTTRVQGDMTMQVVFMP
jgi:hypothetical protein